MPFQINVNKLISCIHSLTNVYLFVDSKGVQRPSLRTVVGEELRIDYQVFANVIPRAILVSYAIAHFRSSIDRHKRSIH